MGANELNARVKIIENTFAKKQNAMKTSKEKIVVKRFIVEIAVDTENISTKYPNYQFNFSSPLQFIKMIASELVPTNSMKQWGYSVKIKPETK